MEVNMNKPQTLEELRTAMEIIERVARDYTIPPGRQLLSEVISDIDDLITITDLN